MCKHMILILTTIVQHNIKHYDVYNICKINCCVHFAGTLKAMSLLVAPVLDTYVCSVHANTCSI